MQEKKVLSQDYVLPLSIWKSRKSKRKMLVTEVVGQEVKQALVKHASAYQMMRRQ